MSPALGVGAASLLFGVALLTYGQNATITGTLAAQSVLKGFTRLRMAPWVHRLVSRLIAVVPAAAVASLYGAEGSASSSSAARSFSACNCPRRRAAHPDHQRPMVMGGLVNIPAQRILYWAIAAILVGLNGTLLLLLAFQS